VAAAQACQTRGVDRLPGRIIVDLEPGADPIAGHVSAHGQQPRSFTGWTGLFATLRAVTSEDGSVAAGDGRAVAPGTEPTDRP
jgi:hypothetical protein